MIVVDHLSTDGTADIAAQHASRLDLRLGLATEGRSASHARNVGIAHARGEFVVLVDADDVVDAALLAAYRRHAEGRRIMGSRHEETRAPRSEGGGVALRADQARATYRFRKGAVLPDGRRTIHRSVFDEIGNFDEALTHGKPVESVRQRVWYFG